MPLDQTDLPIIFALQGGSFFLGPIPAPVIFGTAAGLVRPERLDIDRPTRGLITHTAGTAFLDDFGEGVQELAFVGTTGYDNPTGWAGLASWKALEFLLIEYERRRERTAALLQDPNDVKLYYFDTLNLEAFSLYPRRFRMTRNKQRPLLYNYDLRFDVLADLLTDTLYTGGANLLTSFDVSSLLTGVKNMATRFISGISPLFLAA